VMLKDACDSVLEHEGLGIGYQIDHPEDERVDQINFFHFG